MAFICFKNNAGHFDSKFAQIYIKTRSFQVNKQQSNPISTQVLQIQSLSRKWCPQGVDTQAHKTAQSPKQNKQKGWRPDKVNYLRLPHRINDYLKGLRPFLTRAVEFVQESLISKPTPFS
jgi:hypothetical protein